MLKWNVIWERNLKAYSAIQTPSCQEQSAKNYTYK